MHVIPDHHKELLLKGMGSTTLPEIPKPVVDVYWEYKRVLDRMGASAMREEMTRLFLATVLVAAKFTPPQKTTRLPKCVELVKEGIARSPKCCVKLNGQVMEGMVMSVGPTTAKVCIPADTEPYREFKFSEISDIESPFAELANA